MGRIRHVNVENQKFEEILNFLTRFFVSLRMTIIKFNWGLADAK